jgi:hypothetical protein
VLGAKQFFGSGELLEVHFPVQERLSGTYERYACLRQNEQSTELLTNLLPGDDLAALPGLAGSDKACFFGLRDETWPRSTRQPVQELPEKSEFFLRL